MPLREIKSYVKRDRRLSKHAESLWLNALNNGILIDFFTGDNADAEIINIGSRPYVLEIGFGSGDALIHMAVARPDIFIIGIEVYRAGIIKTLQKIKEQGLTNICLAHANCVDLITKKIKNATLQRVNVFFPDPWPKLKHHKRRLLTNSFIELIASKLQVGGVLHIATDWQEYALQVYDTLQSSCHLSNKYEGFAPYSLWIETKFASKGVREGRRCWELIYYKSE